MYVTFTTLPGQTLTMVCTVDQFLAGPVMSHLAALQNNCDPQELVRDFLPEDLDLDDDDELTQRFAEACLGAASYEPTEPHAEPVPFKTIVDVEVEARDLRDIRERLCAPIMAFLAMSPEPLPAA